MGLPLSDQASSAQLRGVDGQVTFDPLAVATVLPNPRANISATRLYTQHHEGSFRWPYLMMLGGTLPPLGALVEHIVSPNQSIHPALSMALQTAYKLPVRSTTVFRELTVDFSNDWLAEVCNYKPSKNANNDLLVINIDCKDEHERKTKSGVERLRALLFPLVGFFTGAALITELVLSVMLGDIWAAVLFFVFMLHWLASTLISFTSLIGPYENAPAVKEDSTMRFALHERKEGGTIVFKGRQDSIEKWARQTWQFNATLYNKLLHWFWILSGSAGAVASTAAMVNMSAALQLGFLGLLLFSSIAELGLSRLSRTVQIKPHENYYQECKNNAFRSKAIIRAALEGPKECRLQGLDWVELGLLPNIPAFSEMQKMLARMEDIRPKADMSIVTRIVEEYKSSTGVQGSPLVNRIASEALESAKFAFGLAEHSKPFDGKQSAVAGAQEKMTSI